MRIFLAVEIPASIRDKIQDLIAKFKHEALPIKWVAFSNLHITLKFLGEIDAVKKEEIAPVISNISSRYPSFSAGLSTIGCFPNEKNPRVLWIGVRQGADQLGQIAVELDQALARSGFKAEKRFHAHVTIGRARKPCMVSEIIKREFDSELFPVDSIVLFKSNLTPQGPVYEELEKFRLG